MALSITEKEIMNLRVVSLNCWSEGKDYEKRWPFLIEQLIGLKPDVICLQEVFERSKAILIQKALKLPTLVYSKDKGGLCLLSRFPKEKSSTHSLKTISPIEKESRFVLWAQLKIKRQNFDFYVTHLTWRPKEAFIRQKQVLELTQWIEQKNEGVKRAVLTGDMNSISTSDEMLFLIGRKSLGSVSIANPWKDSFAEKHQLYENKNKIKENKKTHTWSYDNKYTHRADLPARRIDYLYYWLPETEKSVKLKQSQRCFTDKHPEGFCASDHFGVVTDFEM